MSDDIIVRVNGDSSDVFDYTKRAELAAINAEQSEKDTENTKAEVLALKQQTESYSTQAESSANSASNSNTSATQAADRAVAAADRAESYKPDIKTSSNGSVLSDSTSHYNFGNLLNVVQDAPGEFTIGVIDAPFMQKSVYDPQGINADAFSRLNHTGTQKISTIDGLQAALDSKADAAVGPGGGVNPLLMAKGVYDPQGINGDAFNRVNHTGVQPISSVDGLQDQLDEKLDSSEFNAQKIANLYEGLPDRNQFTNDLLTKLNGISAKADMLKSVYDPNNVNADAFNANNINFVGFPQNAVLSVVNGKLVDSGMTVTDGSIKAATNSLSLGPHTMSSSGENIMWKNQTDGEIFSVPWVDVSRASVSYPTYRAYIDSAMQTFDTGAGQADIVTDPIFVTAPLPEGTRLWQVDFKSALNINDVYIVLEKSGIVVWKLSVGNLKINTLHSFNLDNDSVPYDAHKGDIFTVKFVSENGPVKLFGTGTTPYIKFYVRHFKDTHLGDMRLEDFDKDSDGVIDVAKSVDGINKAGNSQYYGKNAFGTVGFFDLPTGNSDLSGLMKKSVYDTDNDGVVDHAVLAEKVNGIDSAGNEKYYGTDVSGNVGFHSFPAGSGDYASLKQAVDTNKGDIAGLQVSKCDDITTAVDDSAKTITINVLSENKVIDTEVIDLSSWFSSGPAPIAKDIYFGFNVSSTLDESSVKSGTRQQTSHINGHDVIMSRTDSTKAYMWIWIPDSFGSIRGFDFGGFISVWQSVPLTVNSESGKLFTSPNQTTATNVSFEVEI